MGAIIYDCFYMERADSVDYPDLPKSLSPYPALEQVVLIGEGVKEKIFALGVKGLIIYNVAKFVAAGATVFVGSGMEGAEELVDWCEVCDPFVAAGMDVESRLIASFRAGVAFIALGETPWLIVAILGRSVVKKVRAVAVKV